MAPQLLIFDLDGTLIDSRMDLASAINFVRANYGLEPHPLDIVTGFIGDGARNLVKRGMHKSGVDIDEALGLYMRWYTDNLTVHTKMYPGVEEGLKVLTEAGHQLAVMTNKPGDASREILRRFGLDTRVSSIIGGGDIEKLKPHPMGIQRLMEENSCSESTTWMIGDHHTDLSAAKSAGVFSAYVEYGFGDSRGLDANARFSSFEQLVAFFSG